MRLQLVSDLSLGALSDAPPSNASNSDEDVAWDKRDSFGFEVGVIDLDPEGGDLRGRDDGGVRLLGDSI